MELGKARVHRIRLDDMRVLKRPYNPGYCSDPRLNLYFVPIDTPRCCS